MSNQAPLPVAETHGARLADACCSTLSEQPLELDQAGDLAAVFKALADPVRLRLFSLIASHERGEACVCDLTGGFARSAPTISHHLKTLRTAGLIDCERRGTWVYYWVVPGVLERIGTLFVDRAHDLSQKEAS